MNGQVPGFWQLPLSTPSPCEKSGLGTDRFQEREAARRLAEQLSALSAELARLAATPAPPSPAAHPRLGRRLLGGVGWRS